MDEIIIIPPAIFQLKKELQKFTPPKKGIIHDVNVPANKTSSNHYAIISKPIPWGNFFFGCQTSMPQPRGSSSTSARLAKSPSSPCIAAENGAKLCEDLLSFLNLGPEIPIKLKLWILRRQMQNMYILLPAKSDIYVHLYT